MTTQSSFGPSNKVSPSLRFDSEALHTSLDWRLVFFLADLPFSFLQFYAAMATCDFHRAMPRRRLQPRCPPPAVSIQSALPSHSFYPPRLILCQSAPAPPALIFFFMCSVNLFFVSWRAVYDMGSHFFPERL